MSKEYIDREAALLAIKQAFEKGEGPSLYIKRIPAANVAPVVHGRWIEYPVAHYFKCSNCKYTVPYQKAALLNGKRSYTCCPHCHAVMDKEATDERI